MGGFALPRDCSGAEKGGGPRPDVGAARPAKNEPTPKLGCVRPGKSLPVVMRLPNGSERLGGAPVGLGRGVTGIPKGFGGDMAACPRDLEKKSGSRVRVGALPTVESAGCGGCRLGKPL